jgi:hypothetical protein
MERLEKYDFTRKRELTALEKGRQEFIERLCDGHVWKFHASEYPRTSSTGTPSPSAVVNMLKTRILKKHPKWKINTKIEPEGYIVIRCDRIGG